MPGGAVGDPCPHDGMGGSRLCRCYWLGQLLSGPAGGRAEGMLWAAGARRHCPSAEEHSTRMVLEQGRHGGVRLARVLQQGSCLSAKALHLDK